MNKSCKWCGIWVKQLPKAKRERTKAFGTICEQISNITLGTSWREIIGFVPDSGGKFLSRLLLFSL